MAPKKVGDMTTKELESLIIKTVDMKFRLVLRPATPAEPDQVRALLKAIANRRWTPPVGAPTASQMILEDRNQWRQGMS